MERDSSEVLLTRRLLLLLLERTNLSARREIRVGELVQRCSTFQPNHVLSTIDRCGKELAAAAAAE